jgi:hypothetical protein
VFNVCSIVCCALSVKISKKSIHSRGPSEQVDLNPAKKSRAELDHFHLVMVIRLA